MGALAARGHSLLGALVGDTRCWVSLGALVGVTRWGHSLGSLVGARAALALGALVVRCHCDVGGTRWGHSPVRAQAELGWTC